MYGKICIFASITLVTHIIIITMHVYVYVITTYAKDINDTGCI